MGFLKKVKNLARGKKADGTERKNAGDRRIQRKDRTQLRRKKRRDEKAERKLKKISLKGENKARIWGIRKGNRGSGSGTFLDNLSTIGQQLVGGIMNNGQTDVFQGQPDGSIQSVSTGAVMAPQEFASQVSQVHYDNETANQLPEKELVNVSTTLKYVDVDGDFIDDNTGKYIWNKMTFETTLGYVGRIATANNYTKVLSFVVVPIVLISLAVNGFKGSIKKLKNIFK